METVTVGVTTLVVNENFSGVQDLVNEIIVLSKLMGYKMRYTVSFFDEPQLNILDNTGNSIITFEFGTLNQVLKDINIIVYDEKFYPNDKHEELCVYINKLQPAQKWWNKIKLIL